MSKKRARGSPPHASCNFTMPDYPANAESLLDTLSTAQQAAGFLSREALTGCSKKLHLPDSHTFSVASFYSMLTTDECKKNVIRLCDSPVCALQNSQKIRELLDQKTANTDFRIERASCLGLCDRAPAALINLEACGPIGAENVDQLLDGWRGIGPDYSQAHPAEVRIAMQRIGKIDPNSLQSAIGQDAYESLNLTLASSQQQVLQTVTDSGLQGCGGAGFSTGRKWQMVAAEKSEEKYIICNADESEAALFKDRVLMENDPHLLLEAMAIAGYAVGAKRGVVYIRGEYEQAALCLEQAIAEATSQNYLGENIQGSEFSFHMQLHRGAGAYICGEETALLESLEGRRGEPRIRPPYPTVSGYRGQPTVVNNVETLCKVPEIIRRGAKWHRCLGNKNSTGTKMIALTGHINRPGVYEVPFGISLRKIIDELGGGMCAESQFKMALTGGAAGTIVGQQSLDIPLDYTASKQGISLGGGVVMVMDQTVRCLDLMLWILRFFEAESCGKCTPCREGTREVREIIEQLGRGNAAENCLQELKKLSTMLRLTSFCGLGQSVALPIDSAMQNFSDELSGAQTH